MTNLLFVIVPVLAGVATLAVSLALPQHGLVIDNAISVGRAVGPTVVIFFLLRRFQRGEHLYRIWSALFVAYSSFIFFRLLITWPLVGVVPQAIDFPLRVFFLVIGNIAWVLSIKRLSATWRIADLPGEKVRTAWQYGISLAIALAICGGALAIDTMRGRSFDESIILNGISAMADALACVYMVPAIAIAVRMRGGSASLPIVFFAADIIIEVFVTDLFGLIVRLVGNEESRLWLVAQNSLSVTGNCFMCAGALAYVALTRSIERRFHVRPARRD